MEDPDEDLRALMAAAKGGPLSNWLYERNRRVERAAVAENDDWNRLTPWLLTGRIVTAAISGIVLMAHAPWWADVLALSGVAWLVAYGVLWPIRAAHTYRNGWADRGGTDIVLHEMVCNDPVASHTFEVAVQRENLRAFFRD